MGKEESENRGRSRRQRTPGGGGVCRWADPKGQTLRTWGKGPVEQGQVKTLEGGECSIEKVVGEGL